MIELKSVNGNTLQVADEIFDCSFNAPLVHQIVTAFLAGARRGTKAQKNRASASGGGTKPWRQKGTGRARAGTIRSPIWRGGGCAFAAQPRNYKQKTNRKMYRGALRAILSELRRQQRLHVVEELDIATPRTRNLVALLHSLQLFSTLIIDTELSKNLVLASRNIPHVKTLAAHEIDPVNLLRFDSVLLTEPALNKIARWL